MAKKSKYDLYYATEFHEKRSKRSKAADESKTAKNTKKHPTKAWYDAPQKSDIYGIDTKKVKAKNVKEAIRFLKASLKGISGNKNIEYRTEKKAILTYPRGTINTLQKNMNVRFNNVKIYKRKKKGKSKDFWISVLKH